MRYYLSKVLRKIAVVSPKIHTKILFYRAMGKFLNLKKPITLNEKIHWLKFNEHKGNDIYKVCADKYLVRNYISDIGCSEILNELIGVYDTFDEINFDQLPNKFVLKCNHGAGYNIVVSNKDNFDKDFSRKKINQWLESDYSLIASEIHYKEIPRKIICEKFLENEYGEFPDDYKFYCFNGHPQCVMLCKGRKNGETKFYYFDLDWKLIPLSTDSINAIENDIIIDKPDGYDDMLDYAKKVSRDFKFVRADFYLISSKVIFGELTFTPSAGLDKERLAQTDLLFGEMLKI